MLALDAIYLYVFIQWNYLLTGVAFQSGIEVVVKVAIIKSPGVGSHKDSFNP